MKWEYTYVFISWFFDNYPKSINGKWITSIDGGKTKMQGIDNILNHFGEQGWEAFNSIPTVIEPMKENEEAYETSGFNILFKRPKAESPA